MTFNMEMFDNSIELKIAYVLSDIRRKIDFHLRYYLLFHSNLYLYVPRIKQQRGPHPCEPRMPHY